MNLFIASGQDEIAAVEARQWVDEGALVIDVRDPAIARTAHVQGAVTVPIEMLRTRLTQIETDRARRIVVYCGDGSMRGPEATLALNTAGYTNAVSLKGGIEGWRAAGFPTATN